MRTARKSKLVRMTEAIRADVLRVETHASLVLVVDDEGYPRVCFRRFSAPLNVLAILGPGVFEGTYISEMLLMEIGLGRARPYHDARMPDIAENAVHWIARRIRREVLGAERFARLLPFLSGVIAEYAESLVCRWKHRTWNVTSMRARVVKNFSRREIRVSARQVGHERGVRVSVSLNDIEFIRYVCGCDIARRKDGLIAQAKLLCGGLRNYLTRKFSDAELQYYARTGASRLGLLRQSFDPTIREFGRLSPHHVAYLIAMGKIPARMLPLLEQCARLFHWVDWTRVQYFQKLQLCEMVPHSPYAIWVIPERKSTADYLVCEIIPQSWKQGGSS